MQKRLPIIILMAFLFGGLILLFQQKILTIATENATANFTNDKLEEKYFIGKQKAQVI